MRRKVVVVGANGQLGQDIRRYWEDALRDDLVLLTHAEIEVCDGESVSAALDRLRPDIVINTAAYHKVDQVETNADRAFGVNAIGARNLALACREVDATLIHMSSDYVFSGTLGRPYVETDGVEPVNVYGASKIAGEMLIRYLWPKHFIVRTSGLYGLAGSSGKGANFVELMLRMSLEGKPIRVVDDQVLTPTGTWFVARQLAALSDTVSYGTYHATCQGQCSWYEFAGEIFRVARVGVSLSPQATAASGAAARRPPFSVLENQGLKRLGIDLMPDWKHSLAMYLEQRSEQSIALNLRT
jgi:dTDP-4-dehydrorhamnose reductase